MFQITILFNLTNVIGQFKSVKGCKQLFTLHLGLLSFLGSFCQKNMFSYRGIFNWNILKLFIYCIYSFSNMSYVCLQSNLNKYGFAKVHRLCQILCFVLKNCHNFKSYQNMLTFSSLIFLFYKLQHIHCITFTCRKGLMNFLKT